MTKDSSKWSVSGSFSPTETIVVAYAVGDSGLSTPVYMAPYVDPPGIDIPSIAAEGGFQQGRAVGKQESRLAVEALLDVVVEERRARKELEKEKEGLKQLLLDIYAATHPDRACAPTAAEVTTAEIIREIRKRS